MEGKKMSSLTDNFSKTEPTKQTVEEMLLNYAGLGEAQAVDHYALLRGDHNSPLLNPSGIPGYKRRSSPRETVLDRPPYEAGF